MAALLLSEIETDMAKAVGQGLPFEPAGSEPCSIRAEALRRIILGLPVCFPSDGETDRVRLLAFGLHLVRVRVVGALLLDDAAAEDGGYLPPLHLKDCDFPDLLSMCRARFRHVSFACCTLRHLHAVGLDVAGGLDLAGVTACLSNDEADARRTGTCWIELRDARIGGSLCAAKAHVSAPAKAADASLSGRPAAYALDLRSATIGNELTLYPHFRAMGGVNIRSAQIGKDLLVSGATLTAVEGFALTAAGVHVGGSAICNVATSESGPEVFTAAGDVSFLDATVEGSLEVRGAHVRNFIANNARIGGAALFGVWYHGERLLRFQSDGEVSFYAARIAGTLDMGGACLKRLNADGVTIGGAALIRSFNGKTETLRCRVEEDIGLSSAKIMGNLDISGVTLDRLSAPNIEIGGSVYLTTWKGPQFTCTFAASGDVLIPGANITGSLNASGATMRYLQLDNAEIGGAVFLRAKFEADEDIAFTVDEDVSLMGCKIAGNLEMAGASIGRLFAANARIGGSAFLLASNGKHKTLPFEAKGAVSLIGAVIGGSLEMTGASVSELTTQNADIGGSVLLRAWNGVGGILPFVSAGEVFLLGARIRADLDLSGATLNGALFANNMIIGSNVWLTDWAGQRLTLGGPLDFSGSKISNSLIAGNIAIAAGANIVVDLSHSAAEVLSDENGTAWGDDILLRLEGFRYARLAVTAPVAHARPKSWMMWRRGGQRSSASDDRKRWLRLQYARPRRRPNVDDYSPDPYDRLARAFRTAGYYADAQTITRERLRVERLISGFAFSRPFQAAYAFFFDSGLSPGRAIATFLGCIAIGWGATCVADRGWDWLGLKPVLVLETNTVNSLVVPLKQVSGSFKPGLLIGKADTAAVDELPCGEEIEPLLYALDVFVPALEIHQESRCTITTRAGGFVWRLGRAIYSVLGWVVTALTILTVSGVARRHLEN